MTFQPAAGYPLHRPRRLRGHPRLRALVCETHLTVDHLIYPMFVHHGTNIRREIPSMPGQHQLSLDRLGEAVAAVSDLGIPAIILFGIPEHKDARGSAAMRDDGIVQEAIRVSRQAAPGLLVITDLCFCEYTDHGHCGPLAEIAGRIDKVYVFKPLQGIVIAEIVALKMSGLAKEYGLELAWVDPRLIFQAMEAGNKLAKFGVRELDRQIGEMLADHLIAAKKAGGKRVRLDIEEDGVMAISPAD